MKANELRIGNFVYFYDEVKTIESISIRLRPDVGHFGLNGIEYPQKGFHLKPIPLTEEWLLKFGFIKDNDGCLVKNKCMYWLKDGRLQLAFGYAPLINTPCKYVHQLQNIYFSLKGEELDTKQ